jgi:hypothetical protein
MKGRWNVPGRWGVGAMSVEVTQWPEHWTPPPLWRSHTDLVPILIDYQTQKNTWTVIASFYYRGAWERAGYPALPYIEYQSKNGESWQIVPLEDRVIGFKTNLLAHPNPKGEPDFVSAHDIHARNLQAGSFFEKIVSKWETKWSKP